MPKRKFKVKKSFFRTIHLQALIFFVLYTVVSKYIFIRAVASPNMQVSFFVPYFFGVISGILFLYLFNYEDFFHFMKDVERQEKIKETKMLKKYKHFGKLASFFIIAAIGGPILAALTIRFLINKVWYRYALIAAGNIASTVIAVAVAKGFLKLV